MRWLILLFSLFLISIISPVHAVNPYLDWKTIESDHFYVHFADGYFDQAKQVVALAEDSHDKLAPIIQWQPRDKTHLVLSDETDRPNGYAISFPFNRSVLFLTPPDEANSLEDVDNWLETLIEHEYTHILHLDKASGAPDKLRSVFGRNLFLFPNQFQPAWLIEGLATHIETDDQRGIGRGQSSLFRMMMLEEVRHGIKPVRQVNLPIRQWPMGTSAYLYGVYFFRFLQQEYGQEFIDRMIERYSHNLLPFFINSNSRRVFNKDLEQLWQEFELWLQQEFAEQLKASSQTDIQLSQHGYFTRELELDNKGGLYYVRGSGREHNALMKLDNRGKMHHLVDINPGARINLNPEQTTLLISQPEYCGEYEIFYDLYQYNIKQDELVRLTECSRYRSAAWINNGKHILAIKTVKGVSEIDKLDHQGQFIQSLYRSEPGVVISQPDWSDNTQQLVASVFRPESGWNIELFEVSTKQWTALTRDQHISMYPSFVDRGNRVQYSSDRDGRYNIYQISIDGKDHRQLTRVDSGAFASAYDETTKQLYYLGYHRNGYDVFRSAQQYHVNVKQESNEYIVQTDLSSFDSNKLNIEDYSPWSSLKPRWWFPLFALTDQETTFGLTGSGNDALAIHNYIYSLAYDFKNDYAQGDLRYQFGNNLAFGISRQAVQLLDSQGNLGILRNDDDLYLIGQLNFPKINSYKHIQLGAISSQQSDHYVASGIQPLADSQDRLLGLSLFYSNTQNYILSISESDGVRLRLTAESSDIWDSDFSGEVYSMNLGGFIDLQDEHVLAIQYVHAVSNNQPEPFRLGGEDTDFELLDVLTPIGMPVFGRREFSLRGYAEGLPELTGNNMQLASLEWRFPVNRPETGIMAPPIGLMQMSGTLFYETGGVWNQGDRPLTYYDSLGVELYADVNFFYGITTKIRMGYAKGLNDEIGDDRFYLSLGAAF